MLELVQAPSDAWWNRGTVSDKNAEVRHRAAAAFLACALCNRQMSAGILQQCLAQVREMEAAMLVMKRSIDQLALRRLIACLNRDCGALLGLAFKATPESEQKRSTTTKVRRCSSGCEADRNCGQTLMGRTQVNPERPYSPLAARSPSSSRSGTPRAESTRPREVFGTAAPLSTPTGAFQVLSPLLQRSTAGDGNLAAIRSPPARSVVHAAAIRLSDDPPPVRR